MGKSSSRLVIATTQERASFR
nr:unnamed protein product [Callosobruchus chinensis]